MNKLAKKSIAGGLVATSLIAIAGLSSMTSATTASMDAVEQTRKVSGFKAIALKGPMNGKVTVGKKFSVTVKAPKDMQGKIITELKGDTLVVKMKEGRYGWRESNKIHVVISLPKLEEYTSSGSGDSMLAGKISGKEFELNLNGSGDVTVDYTATSLLDLDLNGSGDVRILGGKCNKIEASLKGSGDIAAKSVKCGEGSFNIMGSGDILAYADKKVKANIMGSGDITIYGSPESLSSRTFGSGEVNVRK